MPNDLNHSAKMEAAGQPRAGGVTILVAGTDAASREDFSHRLTALGYRTLAAENGSAALMLLRSEHPALLLLDQDMPGLSGIDLLRELRGARDSAHLPVIILTRSHDADLAGAALNAGADDHVVLPVDFATLSARIERQLERSRELAALRHAAAALDARLVRRALEIEDLTSRIETLQAEKAALSALLASRNDPSPAASVKSIAAI